MIMRTIFGLVSILIFVSNSASGEVVRAEQNGFEVNISHFVAAAPAAVYDELLKPEHWWSKDHSYSGDARNFYLEPKAGGCFCENLHDGGSVQHLTVVLVQPGELLRLRGALGPLQGLAVDGAMTWRLSVVDHGTEITVVYSIGGHVVDGLENWAAPVDGVILEQVERLARRIETGSPEEN